MSDNVRVKRVSSLTSYEDWNSDRLLNYLEFETCNEIPKFFFINKLASYEHICGDKMIRAALRHKNDSTVDL